MKAVMERGTKKKYNVRILIKSNVERKEKINIFKILKEKILLT